MRSHVNCKFLKGIFYFNTFLWHILGLVLIIRQHLNLLFQVRELVSEASRLSMLPETDFPFAELLLCAGTPEMCRCKQVSPWQI